MNPFFVDINGGSAKKLGKDLYLHYKHAFVLCSQSPLSVNELTSFYDKNTDNLTLKNIVDKMLLTKVDVCQLKNKMFKIHANIIEGSVINELFGHTTDEQNEIVIIAPELSATNHATYNIVSNPVNVMNNLRDVLGLITVYKVNYIDNNILSIINNVDKIKYWENKRNVCFNINDIFNDRKLVETTNIAKHDKTPNYADVFQKSPKFYHSNIYEAIKKSPNRSFYATQPDLSITHDYIADIFDMLDNKKYRFYLFNALLTSKDLCHLVINNPRVLQRNKDLFVQYKMLYSVLLGYAWVSLYIEESIFTTKATKQNRFAFNIETANLLPTFPFTYSHVKMNPYMVLQLSDELMAINANCIGIDALEQHDKYYGVCTFDEACARMNVFTTGNSQQYLFEGLSDIFSVSGSIMTACLPRLNPLFETCTSTHMDYDTAWNTYFNMYYEKSDIDLMCATDTTIDFLIQVTNMMSVIANNMKFDVNDFAIVPNKTTVVVISSSFFEHCIDDINMHLGTCYTQNDISNNISQMVDNSELFPNIKQYFYEMYLTEKKIMTDKWASIIFKHKYNIDLRLLNAYNNVCSLDNFGIKLSEFDILKTTIHEKDSECYYFINDFKTTPVQAHKNLLAFKFSESIKFKIHAPQMPRSIEVFKVDVGDPFKVVARFHKPCVRAYRQGKQIWMLPSFITASMLFLNIDYRYFACSKNPVDIINKYRQRGFGVIINMDERNAMLLHQKNNEVGQIVPYYTGPQKLSSPLYSANDANIAYIANTQQLKQLYMEKYDYNSYSAPIDLMNFSVIQNNGNIRPLQSWIANAVYEYIENK